MSKSNHHSEYIWLFSSEISHIIIWSNINQSTFLKKNSQSSQFVTEKSVCYCSTIKIKQLLPTLEVKRSIYLKRTFRVFGKVSRDSTLTFSDGKEAVVVRSMHQDQVPVGLIPYLPINTHYGDEKDSQKWRQLRKTPHSSAPTSCRWSAQPFSHLPFLSVSLPIL